MSAALHRMEAVAISALSPVTLGRLAAVTIDREASSDRKVREAHDGGDGDTCAAYMQPLGVLGGVGVPREPSVTWVSWLSVLRCM